MQITVDSIKYFFQSFDRNKNENYKLIPAAVLILIFEKNGQLHITLTKRTDSVNQHKGEISFPGGTVDSTDSTIIDTALREAGEEIGLSRKSVEVLGLYNDFITHSGFCITPVVAFLPSMIKFLINISEVSEIFFVPMSFFINNKNEQITYYTFNGIKRSIYHYQYGEHEIWGATAAIVRSFLIDLVKQNG